MKFIYAALLYLYPRAFRARYRTELLEVFEVERAQPRHRGARGALRFWRFILPDLCASAARQRWRTLRAFSVDRNGGGVPRLPNPPRRSFMETLVQDVRYALRQFARRPGFTAVAVLSLALGIGANSVIYGLLDGYVFNPFPYPDAHRLMAIGTTFPKVSSDTTYVETLSPAEYLDIRGVKSFSAVGAFDLGNRNLSGGDVPERVFTAFLADDLFPVLGMKPLLGRGFTAEELAPDGPPVAIISHRLWRNRLGSDPRILERPVRIGGQTTSVVGVMPPGLTLVGTDMWLPWGADPLQVPRNARNLTIVARLAPGASAQQANAELAALAGRVQQEHSGTFKEYEGWRLTATPWAAAMMQDLRGAAVMLLVAVALVLLIACANLTNLMLARASSRSRELAVRLALGAARWRIARQLLTESVLLALIGAAAGLLVAHIALQFSSAIIPAQFQALGLGASVNVRVLGWSVAAALAAAVLVALLPMLQASRTDPHDSLRSETRTGANRAGTRVRQGLIVAEIALSVVLLLGAGLLLRSVRNIQSTELGYDPKGVLAMRLTLPAQKYRTGEAMMAFFEELARRVSAEPGVTAAAMASQRPPSGAFNAQVEVEGSVASGATLPSADTTVASRDFFRTLGVPLARGRLFDSSDTPAAPPRVIVNSAFVRSYLKDRDPLAARIRLMGRGGPGPWTEIVGVVGDARNNGAASPVRPEVFIPMEQGRDVWNQLFLIVRGTGPATDLLPQVRSVVASMDPEQPVYAIQTLEETLAQSSFQQRITGLLLSIFAAVALVMAAVGIYGVMSYAVSTRTREIGVRMAIGAERSDVIRLVLGQVVRMVIAGAVIGVALLLIGGKFLSGLLHGVTPSDPLTIAVVIATLGAVALLAAWIPARRASRVNPIEALRYE